MRTVLSFALPLIAGLLGLAGSLLAVCSCTIVPLFASFPEDQLRMLTTVVTRKSAPRSTTSAERRLAREGSMPRRLAARNTMSFTSRGAASASIHIFTAVVSLYGSRIEATRRTHHSCR